MTGVGLAVELVLSIGEFVLTIASWTFMTIVVGLALAGGSK